MAQNKDLVADSQTLLEENLSEKKSVESARRLSFTRMVFLGQDPYNLQTHYHSRQQCKNMQSGCV